MAEEEDEGDLLGFDGAELLGGDLLYLLGAPPPPPIRGLLDAVGGPIGGPVGERVYLVSATLYPDWTDQTPTAASGVPPAIANHPIAGFPFGSSAGEPPPIELRYATIDFATKVDDPDLPSTFWDGRVIDPGSLSLSLALTPAGSAAIETSIGHVVLDNTDGEFDAVLDQNAALSQSLDIRLGTVGAWIEDFVTVFHARITGIGMTEHEVTIELQDPVLYAQNLYPTTVYTGLGGVTGDAELEGVVRPVVLGTVWNMSPVLINAVSLIYQVHDGAISAVTGVFDGGVALAFDANYASYGALSAAGSIGAGEYGTCLAEGLIRVGGTPAFALTANVNGHSAAGTTVKSIATWLIGQLDTQLGLDVDSASFDALPEWTAGWMWTDTFAYAEAISRFVGDGGYHWGADTNGTIRALKLTPPDAGDVSASYDVHDIMGIERTSLPDGYNGIHHRRTVRFGRNWTVQDDSALAATAASRAARQREWKQATSSVSTISRNAIDPPVIETSLTATATAAALAADLITLHGATRRMFSLEVTIFGSIPQIGETIRVTYPRFGLAGSDVFRVVAIDLRLAAREARFLLWG